MNLKTSLLACASALSLIAVTGSPAFAADEDNAVTELVITGTSIRGVAAAGSPTTSIDVEQIKASGVASASDVTRLLPSILNLGADESRNSFTTASGGGGAQDAAANGTAVRSVNLRGIGPEATLLLVNGRRVPPSGVIKAIADIDTVPTAALKRIEVVSDGASAIYGGDAVAGVVNLITKKGVNGGETVLRYGGADGMDQFTGSQTWGKTWKGGAVFIAYEKNNRTNLSGADRDFASQNRTARGGSDARPFTAAPGNILISTAGAACSAAGATCVRYALPTGNGTGVVAANILPGGNRFDEAAFADLLPVQKRDSTLLNAQQQITDKIDVWYEGFYSARKFDLAAPPALFSLAVPSTNPFYVRPAGAPAGANEQVEYRFLDDSNPNSDGYERTYQNAVGFGWDIGKAWRLEASADASKDRGLQRRQSVLNNVILAAALSATTTATAFNPFGDGTFNRTNNPALVELIDGERNQFATSTTKDYQFKFDGPLFDLPAGAVKLAVGGDYHDNKFQQALYATNVSSTGAVTTKFVLNKRDIKGAFAELFIPVVGDANGGFLMRRLDVSLAGRYDKYSDFGKTTNPKVGVIWGPTEGLRFRGTYGTSFRAPSLVDAADQIQNIFIQNLTNTTGTLRGVFYNGGNSKLKPEEAKTYTAGFDWDPKVVPGLRLTGTYYKINYTDRIDVTPNTALTNPAYAAFVIRRPTPGVADAAFDALVTAFMASPDLQNPVESILNINAIIDGRRANLGSLVQEGADLGASLAFKNMYGDWTVGVDVSKIFKLTRITVAGTPVVDVLDTFGNPVDLRARASLGWRKGAWSANGFINYTDEYTNTAVTPNVTVSDYTTFDASVAYRFEDDGLLKGLRVSVSGQNLFDRDPPVVLNGTVSWDSQAASPVGRFLALEISKPW